MKRNLIPYFFLLFAALDAHRNMTCLNHPVISNKRFLVYQNGSLEAVRIPYPGWTSVQIIANIADILLREIMGYATVLVSGSSRDEEVISQVMGCKVLDDPSCTIDDIDNPAVHFSLETWTAGVERVENAPTSIRPTLISILDYYLDDGYFLWQDVVDAGLNYSNSMDLSDYVSYNATNDPAPRIFFDSWTTVYRSLSQTSLVKCSEIFELDSYNLFAFGATGPVALANSLRVTNTSSFECDVNDTVWFSPACRSNTSACIPLVVMYFYDSALQRAIFLNLPVALMMVNSFFDSQTAYVNTILSTRFLFHWYEPDDSLLDYRGRPPVLLNLPRMNLAEQASGLFRTGVEGRLSRSYAWQQLKEVPSHSLSLSLYLPPSFPPFLPTFLPFPLPLSLPPSFTPSLSCSLPPSLSLSLARSLARLRPILPLSPPTSLPPTLPTTHPSYLPPALFASLLSFLHPFRPPCVPPSPHFCPILPPVTPPSLVPSLSCQLTTPSDRRPLTLSPLSLPAPSTPDRPFRLLPRRQHQLQRRGYARLRAAGVPPPFSPLSLPRPPRPQL